MSSHRSPVLRLSVVAVTLALAACSGGSGGPSSPTAPTAPGAPEASAAVLSTQWGDLRVESNGHAVDLDRARASIEVGFEKGRRQIGSAVDRMWLAGYRIVVMPPAWELNGQHLRDTREIRIRAGVEHVLEHELQHFFAWELGRFSECRTFQDHPGGYDLFCQRL